MAPVPGFQERKLRLREVTLSMSHNSKVAEWRRVCSDPSQEEAMRCLCTSKLIADGLQGFYKHTQASPGSTLGMLVWPQFHQSLKMLKVIKVCPTPGKQCHLVEGRVTIGITIC
jgi:hypothetical protein